MYSYEGSSIIEFKKFALTEGKYMQQHILVDILDFNQTEKRLYGISTKFAKDIDIFSNLVSRSFIVKHQMQWKAIATHIWEQWAYQMKLVWKETNARKEEKIKRKWTLVIEENRKD